MQIVSYRGPTQAGGVSNVLSQIDNLEKQSGNWFYIKDNELWLKKSERRSAIYKFDKVIQRNHYRYCNNFLWPILHDMPKLAKYSLVERLHYKVFNSSLALNLKRPDNYSSQPYFINDYQLALVPKFLSVNQNKHIFWHIPWPKVVLAHHVDALSEIAEGLLNADVIGFHTQEFKDNFERFLKTHMPFVAVNSELVVAPLGIDYGFWQKSSIKSDGYLTKTNGLPYVLSVDRVDYTKGVRERLFAIDHFFKTNPDWLKKVVFIQHCGRSRPGLGEFDKYWRECKSIFLSVNENHSQDGWQPIIWSDEDANPNELASYYANASVMLVNPIRDGLNLTAKEFVSSQRSNPGVLALSKGAGVWSELGFHCLTIKPNDSQSFAHNILYGLSMSDQEKFRRHRLLRNCVVANSLSLWWQTFLDIEDKLMRQGKVSVERICG